MNSLKEVITEVTAMQAVIAVLVNERYNDQRFRTDVIRTINHLASTMSTEDGEKLQEAAKRLIQG
ncbi:hypothetical protein ACL5HQ_13840 [Stenotrophomonas maltophilia]|uniref:hypothetical protein n=1 Tax=Stenotrophomonas maltophilia TaxID=40324 RepID=UPI0013DAB888|nr:hypothetical protein [Stenotrophomonas maltophilia]